MEFDNRSLKEFIGRHLEGSPFYLVEAKVAPDNTVDVEIDGDQPVDMDTCVSLTAAIQEEFGSALDDFDLTVGSAGITSPLRHPRQWQRNVGNEIEVLTLDGKKTKGALLSAGDDSFVISVERKTKPEGAKRPVIVKEPETIRYDNLKYAKNLLQF